MLGITITTTRRLYDLKAAAVDALADRDMALVGEQLAADRAARAQGLTDALWRRLHEQHRDLTAQIVRLTAERDAARAAAEEARAEAEEARAQLDPK
ncbi:hypothetical protein [Streptomyces cinereoruber]|uniref:hypothetical protein n=1 Tax=Streptomyces cinereoruber TaxID=67260 RepID=UPI00363B0EEE